MKKVIERMNAGVTAEPQRALASKDTGKKRWLGGVVRKVTGSGTSTPAISPPSDAQADDGDPMRVDFYLVVFLKFIASIVPTIEVDSTTPM
jgi:ubiquitin-like-conjugating enzyme ATG3